MIKKGKRAKKKTDQTRKEQKMDRKETCGWEIL